MKFDYIHFYVEDAQASRDWFVQQLDFQAIGSTKNQHSYTEVLSQGRVYFLLSSPITEKSPVLKFLQAHPPGIVDVAFQVENLELVLAQAIARGVKLQSPVHHQTTENGQIKWSTLVSWGGLQHTLIEVKGNSSERLFPYFSSCLTLPQLLPQTPTHPSETQPLTIDHVVLNVKAGDLAPAVQWYQTVLGFQCQQSFTIQTNYSGLYSQVLTHPNGDVKFPINEPISEQSQIQEFLECNRGSGIQHLALQTADIIKTVKHLRAKKLPFLSIPKTYYEGLQNQGIDQRLGTDWSAIQEYQILVDWQQPIPEAVLLQIFTQPIFNAPTFFFEFIERRSGWSQGKKIQAEGFGAGNFQALYEAVEQEQLKRGLES
ncbi:MAG: 4-hydroxyphenylpyruvate dioxygenase [Microcoleaceae cyanobacterium]